MIVDGALLMKAGRSPRNIQAAPSSLIALASNMGKPWLVFVATNLALMTSMGLHMKVDKNPAMRLALLWVEMSSFIEVLVINSRLKISYPASCVAVEMVHLLALSHTPRHMLIQPSARIILTRPSAMFL